MEGGQSEKSYMVDWGVVVGTHSRTTKNCNRYKHAKMGCGCTLGEQGAEELGESLLRTPPMEKGKLRGEKNLLRGKKSFSLWQRRGKLLKNLSSVEGGRDMPLKTTKTCKKSFPTRTVREPSTVR